MAKGFYRALESVSMASALSTALTIYPCQIRVNGKEHLRHRAVSLRQHGFLVHVSIKNAVKTKQPYFKLKSAFKYKWPMAIAKWTTELEESWNSIPQFNIY